MENKLLDYQITHIDNLIQIINNNQRALDLSDTGTGKTYTTIALCKKLNLIPFIICPKSVISNWANVLKLFSYTKSEYELTTYNQILNHKFIQKTEDEYIWSNIQDIDRYLFIFDEAHKCKNKDTINAGILLTLSDIPNTNIIMLSATAVDKFNNFYVYGYVLGIYSDYINGMNWINTKSMYEIHRSIFPIYASRMSIDTIQDIFKNNIVEMDGIEMDNYYEIELQYDMMNKLSNQENVNNLAQIQLLREKIEFLKIDTFAQMTKEYIQSGKSVVIFVNFTKTLLKLASVLDTKCIIYGNQSIIQRASNIEDFNQDKSRIIICNIQSGGCGISLHDIRGIYPRVSLISPTWSAQDLLQVLGRIHRAMAKSDALQKIIFCKDTFEENIGQIIKYKINNIRTLNNGKIPLKNDSMKNIIEKEFNIKKQNENKELNLDIDIIYNKLLELYSEKEQYELTLNSNLTEIKKKEFNYKLNKIINKIELYENKIKI
jgi:superfamily II DNA or RNA helicase